MNLTTAVEHRASEEIALVYVNFKYLYFADCGTIIYLKVELKNQEGASIKLLQYRSEFSDA